MVISVLITRPSVEEASQVKIPVKAHRKGPLQVVIDSTGVRVFGEGEWRMVRNQASHYRGWVKVHVGVCAQSQQIVAASVTDRRRGDAQELPGLLAHVSGEIEEVIADGAYDAESCYRAIYAYGATPLISPRKGAKIKDGDPAMESRNRAIIRIRDQKRGKKRWKKERDYGRRSLVETAMHRLKSLGGSRFRARLQSTQLVELAARIFVLNELAALRG